MRLQVEMQRKPEFVLIRSINNRNRLEIVKNWRCKEDEKRNLGGVGDALELTVSVVLALDHDSMVEFTTFELNRHHVMPHGATDIPKLLLILCQNPTFLLYFFFCQTKLSNSF